MGTKVQFEVGFFGWALENVYAWPSKKAIVARATGFIEGWLNSPGKEAVASRPCNDGVFQRSATVSDFRKMTSPSPLSA